MIALIAVVWLLVAAVTVLVFCSLPRDDGDATNEEWDIALANAVDLATSARLELADDRRVPVADCLRRAMRFEPSESQLAEFTTLALSRIDARRRMLGLRPLDYAVFDPQVPAQARVDRGHPDGIAETLYEAQMREEEDDA